MIEIDIDQAEILLQNKKLFLDDIVMACDKFNSIAKFTSSLIYDVSSNNIIQGLGMIFESIDNGNYTKSKFCLTYRNKSGKLDHLLRLDCCPDIVRSHVDHVSKTRFFGTHIHRLNEVTDLNYSYSDISNWSEALDIFARRVNLKIESKHIARPFDFLLS